MPEDKSKVYNYFTFVLFVQKYTLSTKLQRNINNYKITILYNKGIL